VHSQEDAVIDGDATELVDAELAPPPLRRLVS
jgi:hypothetical protein